MSEQAIQYQAEDFDLYLDTEDGIIIFHGYDKKDPYKDLPYPLNLLADNKFLAMWTEARKLAVDELSIEQVRNDPERLTKLTIYCDDLVWCWETLQAMECD